MITIKENQIDLNTYMELRESVNWKKLDKVQAQKALDNSLYLICAYDGDVPVGMGRIVGDGAVIDYIQDLVVRPEYQGKGVGKLIIEELIDYVKNTNQKGNEIMLCLMCAKGREEFYKKFDFIARPTDALGPGMIRYIKEVL